jgi:hypothetical protein
VKHGVGAGVATDLAMRNPEPPSGGEHIQSCYAMLFYLKITEKLLNVLSENEYIEL